MIGTLSLKDYKEINNFSVEESQVFDKQIEVTFVKTYFFVFKKCIKHIIFRKNKVIKNNFPLNNGRFLNDCETRLFRYYLIDGTELETKYQNLIMKHIEVCQRLNEFEQRKIHHKIEINKIFKNI